MMALRFALLLPTACAVLLFRRAQHAGQRMQFLDHQGGLSADQVEAGWEAPVLPLCGDLVADPVGGQAQDQGDAGWEAPVVADPVGGQAQDDAGWEAPVVADPVGGQAPKKGRAGRKRKAWTEHESVQKTEKLRKAALSWLKGHDKVHKVLTSSTWCGKRTYLAKCARCQDCSLEWCFSERPDGNMLVEITGECNQNPNKKAIRRSLAKQLAVSKTPAQAQKEMEALGIPREEGPPAWQLQNFRPRRAVQIQKQAADCLCSLRSFLQNPPENIRVDADSLTCEVDQVRILFSVPEAADWFQTCDLPWFLMDFTMKTNAPGLVLGAIGPIGLKRYPNGKPHLRFVPVQYLLSHVEDQEAHGLLIKKYVAMAESAGIELTDGIFDWACYAGAKAALSEEGMPQAICLHRCLQHTKENMKEAAKKRDPASGQGRLKNMELLPVLLEVLQFSAWLPSDEDAP